jgi:high affinity Mn2+ porin
LLLRLLVIGAVLLWRSAGFAQSSGPAADPQPPAEQQIDDPETRMFEHSATSPLWISGQINEIAQGHPSFPAQYSGPNSLKSTSEFAVSNVLTLYTAYEFNDSFEGIFDVEEASGHGISDALGLGGYVNLDVVRNPDLGKAPYVARLMLHKVFRLGKGSEETERGPLSLFTELPAKRLEVRVGKFSIVDFFDLNSVGSDSHLQFNNWCVDNNGAYDYAANTRGYTWGAIATLLTPRWAVRYALAMMPKIANGENLDADLFRASGQNLEFEYRGGLLPQRAGVVRLLSYLNTANMGSYQDSIDQYKEGEVSTPDITATRRQGRHKYGFGLNVEQIVVKPVRVFARLGWSDGHNESFAYTEVDRTAVAGFDVWGGLWKRKLDKVGVAYVMNGLSGCHREYLALGGLGFVLGDGALNYGREQILETYYTTHVWRGLYFAPLLQYVTNPGYNRARGPVLAYGLRMHLEF